MNYTFKEKVDFLKLIFDNPSLLEDDGQFKIFKLFTKEILKKKYIKSYYKSRIHFMETVKLKYELVLFTMKNFIQ